MQYLVCAASFDKLRRLSFGKPQIHVYIGNRCYAHARRHSELMDSRETRAESERERAYECMPQGWFYGSGFNLF
jgi:hypothetical protein